MSNFIIDPYRFVTSFTPNSISDLWAWYQAESSFMTLSGSDITAWNPQTNLTAKKLIADSTGVAPTLGTYNSRGIAQFDGTEWMHTNDDSYTLTQPFTFAIAMKFPTAVAKRTIFDCDDTTNRMLNRNNDSTAGKQLQIHNGATYESSDEGVIAATWGTEIIVVSGTDTKWHINGTDVAPSPIDVTDDFNPLTIMADYGGNNDATGDIMHFIIYDKALDDDEIAELEEWLANEVGL